MQIRDKFGVLIGEIIDTGDGREARSDSGRLLGTYNESEDRTYDQFGTYFADGDRLIALIHEE